MPQGAPLGASPVPGATGHSQGFVGACRGMNPLSQGGDRLGRHRALLWGARHRGVSRSYLHSALSRAPPVLLVSRFQPPGPHPLHGGVHPPGGAWPPPC